MYARQVKQRTLTLGVSGMLWQSSVVLYDKETGSLWSHLLGVAKGGPLRGTRLTPIPSTITTWEQWVAAHPQSTVGFLPRSARRFNRGFYQLRPGQFVVGLRRGEHARAWDLRELAVLDSPCVNETWQGVPLVVVLEKESYTARIFSRRVGNRVLEFAWQGDRWVDRQTGTSWHPVTGLALEGELKGKRLEALEGILSYRRAWQDFHPRSSYWPSRSR